MDKRKELEKTQWEIEERTAFLEQVRDSIYSPKREKQLHYFAVPELRFDAYQDVSTEKLKAVSCNLFVSAKNSTNRTQLEKTKKMLLALGWVDKGDVLVRYSDPRIGWKPADGTLIIGYRECPYKVYTVKQIDRAIG